MLLKLIFMIHTTAPSFPINYLFLWQFILWDCVKHLLHIIFMYVCVCFCIRNVFIGMVPHHLDSWCLSCCFPLKETPSVSLAFLPVGWKDSGAANTQNYCLHVAKACADFTASWALHLHEEGIGALHQALLVFPLLFCRGVKEILSERQVVLGRSSPLETTYYVLSLSV